jgi:hypothetical protein
MDTTKVATLMLVGMLTLPACATAAGAPVAGPTSSPSESATPTPSPTPTGNGEPVTFVLRKTYKAGGKTAVKLRNDGTDSYKYNSYYEACKMVFRTRSGRRFLVPEGTHCDLVMYETLDPGETVTLFHWDLDECIDDQWGCVKARDLRPGRYTMTDRLRPEDGGDAVEVIGRIRIVKST